MQVLLGGWNIVWY